MTHAVLEQDTAQPAMDTIRSPVSMAMLTSDAGLADPLVSDKRLEDRTVKELRMLASQLGIRGRSKLMHKEELICVIRRRW